MLNLGLAEESFTSNFHIVMFFSGYLRVDCPLFFVCQNMYCIFPCSVASMDLCVRHFKDATGCSPGEAIVAATLHPAQALGLDKERGTLSYRARADLVILNSSLFVQATCIAGELVWCRQGSRFN